MVKPDKKPQENIVLSTKIFNDIQKREMLGEKLKQHEKLWFNNIKGVRRSNLTFAMTNSELEEYMKCKMSVHYFAENYCQIKREDGSIGKMTLRDYQKDIIDLYTKNRFSILMASRQTGKCNSFSSNVLVLDEDTEYINNVPFYKLYYDAVRQERKLNILERMKIFLYRLYMKL